MPTLISQDATLADWAKRLDPDGTTSDIAEILSQTNEILDDAVWMEGNLPTGHKSTVRTGLPSGTVRRINQGVKREKTSTEQIEDSCAMLETYSEVDKSLADLNGNTSMYLKSESDGFLEGLNETMAKNMLYSDSDIEPENFRGIAPRFSGLGDTNGRNVIDAGGTGSDNTSIFLVGWASDKASMFFPKGSKAGLQMDFKGQQSLLDADGNRYEGYRTHYKWDAGMCIRDWRYVVRICNIDVEELTKDATGNSADLTELISQALELIPNLGACRPAFYCNRIVSSSLRSQMVNQKNVRIQREEVFGKMVTAAEGVPIRRVDQILNSEARVV